MTNVDIVGVRMTELVNLSIWMKENKFNMIYIKELSFLPVCLPIWIITYLSQEV